MKKLFNLFSLSSLLVLLSTNISFSQLYSNISETIYAEGWELLTSPPPTTYKYVQQGSTVFTATSSGVFRSANGGDWEALTNGIPQENSVDIEVIGDAIFVLQYAFQSDNYTEAIYKYDLYRSIDNGLSFELIRNWNIANNLLTSPFSWHSFSELEQGLNNSLYFIVHQRTTIGEDYFAHYTTDLGDNWTTTTNAYGLTCTTTGTHMMCATSEDFSISSELDFEGAVVQSFNNTYVGTLIALEYANDQLYAFFRKNGDAASENFVLTSSDLGQTWNEELITGLSEITKVSTDGNLFYLTSPEGLFQSTDANGNNYASVFTNEILPLTSTNVIDFLPDGIYMSTAGNLTLVSTDQLATWQEKWQGLKSVKNTWICMNDEFWAASGGVYFRTTDHGITWEILDNPLLSSASRLFGHNGFVFVYSDGILYRSADNGATFAELPFPISTSVDLQSDGTRLWLNDTDFWYSDDSGANWAQILVTTPMTLLYSKENTLIAQLEDSNVLVKSIDLGLTWTTISPDYIPGYTGGTIEAIVIEENKIRFVHRQYENNQLFEVLYASNDLGENWIPYFDIPSIFTPILPEDYSLEMIGEILLLNRTWVNTYNYSEIISATFISSDEGDNWDKIENLPVQIFSSYEKNENIYAGNEWTPLENLNLLQTVDLSLKLSADDLAPPIYTPVVFTITVENTSDRNATGIIAKIERPAELAFVSDNTSQGTYDSWISEWTIGSLAAGETATLTLTLYNNTEMPVSVFAQLIAANQIDGDSEVDNWDCNTSSGINCLPNEDDEATITINDPCGLPIVDGVEVISGNVVRVDWADILNAEKYKLRYRAFGSTAAWTEKKNTVSYIFLNQLAPNTTYEYNVKTVCDGSTSAWSPLAYFTTADDLCDRPIPVVTFFAPTTEVHFDWVRYTDDLKYKLRYKTNGSSWVERISTSSHYEENLVAGATYKYKTKTKCSTGWTNWSNTNSFTVPTSLLREVASSPIVTNETSLQLFPNPTNGQTTIVMDLSEAQKVRINLIDLTGKTLKEWNTNLEAGTQNITVDLSAYPKGMYMIKVESGTTFLTQKLIIE